jgi:tetratricopeptide (TPR) repeat protein
MVIPPLAGAVFLATAVLLLSASAHAADLPAIEALYNSGKYAEVIEAAEKAFQSGDRDAPLSIVRIRAELATGAYTEALQTLEAALARYGTNLALRLVARDVYLRNNQPEQAETQLATMQTLGRQFSWRYNDAPNLVLLGRALLLSGAEPRQVLELLYDKAAKERPQEPEAHLAIAELALDKNDDALAAQSLAKVVKLLPDNPQVHYLLARAYASGDSKRATLALAKALELNPRHVPSLLFEVDELLDAEDHARAESRIAKILEINPREPLAWAYRAVAAHLAGDEEKEQAHRAKALEPWAKNPEVDHLIGRQLARHYRFAEAAAYQRRALENAPDYVPAKIQLSQDLLRLGEEEEGWQLANEAFERDGYNVVAHNLSTLHEALAKFRTLEADGFIVRMDAREAEVYGRRVLDLLGRARETLCKKYEAELDEPVIVEIFPQQKDFAIRTFGLPGGAGFLGVCFGRVITANSPASQGDHPSNWEAVLWHEFCHVVTLTKTRNKMPRWLSEGISVYEERQENPTWGQAMSPKYRTMTLGEELTPVSKLSGAFLKPRSPLHLQFAYFESSLVVEYLVGRYGLPALRRILTDLADDVPINQALARHTEKIDQLDAEFAAYAHERAQQLAPDADWSELELADAADAKALAKWNEEHPQHYEGLRRQAGQLVEAKQWSAAKPVLQELAKIHPASAYPLLAQAHRALKETADERATLEKLAELENDLPDAYLRLIELAAAKKDWKAVERNVQRMLAVNPLVPAPYRELMPAAEALEHVDEAVRAAEALLLLDESDPAETHYRLAKLLHRQGSLESARRHVLQALEEAPRYRAAQRLLLDIVKRDAKEGP